MHTSLSEKIQLLNNTLESKQNICRLNFIELSENLIFSDVKDLNSINESELIKLLDLSYDQLLIERRSFANDFLYSSNVEFQIMLYLIIKKLWTYSDCIKDKLQENINNEDEWLMSISLELLNKSSTKLDSNALDSVLSEMRKLGVNEYPYQLGISLSKELERNQKYFSFLLDKVKEDNINFLNSILATFSMTKNIPIEAELFILNTIKTNFTESKVFAIIASSNCRILKMEATRTLYEELDSISWVERGNAVASLGLLGVQDKVITRKIAALLNDENGNDWTVQEKVIVSLGMIGRIANTHLDDLLSLLEKELKNHESENKILLICQALSEIDTGSEIVINYLIQVVEICSGIAVTAAIKTLSKFKSKSVGVIPYLKKYIDLEDFLSSDLTDEPEEHILLDSLKSILGEKNRMLETYLQNLKNSPYEDLRSIALNYQLNSN